MAFKSLTTLLFITIASYCIAQDNRELVNLANRKITVEDFIRRFELTPRIRNSADIDTQKVHFLLSLAAEKLWAEEAYAMNMDTVYSFRQYIKNMEKLLVRDKLFEKVVLDSIHIAAGQINEAIKRKSIELQVAFLFSEDKDEIDGLYKKLISGVSIAELIKDRPEKSSLENPEQISFGDVGEDLENLLYSLKPGEFSEPLERGPGYVIYYLTDRKLNAFQDITEKDVLEPLQERRKKKLMESYTHSLIKDKTVYADSKVFSDLVQALTDRLSQNFPSGGQNYYYLYEDDFASIEKGFSGDALSSVFIKFKDDPVNMKEFIYYLSFNNFKVQSVSQKAVAAQLNAVVRDFIKLELITREGYSRNYDKLPEIRKELEQWEDNYLAQLLKNRYTDSARTALSENPEEAYDNNKTAATSIFAEVTIVKTKTLEDVEVVLNQLENTSDLKLIAKKYKFDSENHRLKPLHEYGSLSDIIGNMNEGDIYGPVKKQEGYIIIKNEKTEKRKNDTGNVNPEEIRQKLFYKKLKEILETKTVELAEKYNLRLNESLAAEIKVNPIPTMVYRFYGFGGQTAAAPFLNLFYEWFHKPETEEI